MRKLQRSYCLGISLPEALAASLMAAFTGLLAYIRFPLPFSPVPVTAQTFGVMLAGSLLGARAGALSMVLLLVLGLVGLPVFSGGQAGPGVVLGPTGGYLLAFPLAAGFIGLCRGRPGSVQPLARWFLIHALGGMGLIYLLGAGQLALVTGLDPGEAFRIGVLAFLPGDIFKVVSAALVSRKLGAVGPMLMRTESRASPGP